MGLAPLFAAAIRNDCLDALPKLGDDGKNKHVFIDHCYVDMVLDSCHVPKKSRYKKEYHYKHPLCEIQGLQIAFVEMV